MGGGFGLVAASDLVIVDEEASLGTPEIKVGLFPMIILAALQREIPRKALMELVLTGGKLSAARAVELGVANRVAPRGTALNEAITMARTIAALSPAIVGLGKSVFHRAEGLPYDQALQWLVSQLTLTLMTEDAGEGIAAFVERRPPVWRGR
jgi:enoyl-CoA hydratase/carnithine racemase